MSFSNDRPNVSSVDSIFAMEPSLIAGTFKTEDGRRIFFRRWIPDCQSKGTIVIVHGLGEHSGRYVHVGDFFVRAGFAAFAFDLRGHGSSEGAPVFIKSYQEYLDDLESAITYLERPERLILFGHSLGGQIVLARAQSEENPATGYIAASPWLNLSRPPSIWLEGIASMLNLVLPAQRFPTGIQPGETSRDQALLDSFPDLDKGHRFITVRTYFEISKMSRQLMAHPSVNAPVLLTHGETDTVTSIEATRAYFEKLIAPSKAFISYPDGRHELHNDLVRETVLNNYLAWIEKLSASTQTVFPAPTANPASN
jgi:alpha-beta hydrolase superfamily lysophospholipase